MYILLNWIGLGGFVVLNRCQNFISYEHCFIQELQPR